MYADYAYYTGAYYGQSISEEDFLRLATRASQYIDYYTMGKAKKYPEMEAIKMACCALAEQYQIIDKSREQAATGEQDIQSESVGKWSRTYSSRAESQQFAQSQLQDTIYIYLAHTGLLYRGGCCKPCNGHIL